MHISLCNFALQRIRCDVQYGAEWTLLSVADTSVGSPPPCLTPDPTSDPCKFLIKDHRDDDDDQARFDIKCKMVKYNGGSLKIGRLDQA